MKTYEEMEAQLLSFLTSTLDVLSVKRHAPVFLFPGQVQPLHFVEEDARSTVQVSVFWKEQNHYTT
jgi:hypothetical protein